MPRGSTVSRKGYTRNIESPYVSTPISTPELHSYPSASLLGIPPELRHQIYKETFEGAIDSEALPLLLSCRQIYHEAHVCAFQKVTFVFQTSRRWKSMGLKAAGNVLGEKTRLITRLRVQNGPPTLCSDGQRRGTLPPHEFAAADVAAILGELSKASILPTHVTVECDIERYSFGARVVAAGVWLITRELPNKALRTLTFELVSHPDGGDLTQEMDEIIQSPRLMIKDLTSPALCEYELTPRVDAGVKQLQLSLKPFKGQC